MAYTKLTGKLIGVELYALQLSWSINERLAGKPGLDLPPPVDYSSITMSYYENTLDAQNPDTSES